MEAQLFQKICNALEDKTFCIKISVSNLSPITKVIWSSFDFLSGPNLKFIWEAEYSAGNVYDSISVNDGNISTDSSTSKNTFETPMDQYEEIDEILNEDLITGNNFDQIDFFNIENDNQNITESAISEDTNSTLTGINLSKEQLNSKDLTKTIPLILQSSTTSTIEDESTIREQKLDKTNSSLDNKNELIKTNSLQNLNKNFKQIQTKPSISMQEFQNNITEINLIEQIEDLNLNKSNVCYFANSNECKINLNLNMYKKLNENIIQDIHFCEEVNEDNEKVLHQMNYTNSNTSRFNSENNLSNIKFEFYREAKMLSKLNTIVSNDLCNDSITDEKFITKFVLAEQIWSSTFLSNSVIHKFTTLPTRNIAVGSYVFSLKNLNDTISTSVSAFSIVVPLESSFWYTQRQLVIEEFFFDLISILKAAYLAEHFEEIICRLTKELINFFELYAALERWPLINTKNKFLKLQSSYFFEKNNTLDMFFLAKTITALLITKGMCTIVGTDSSIVLKMMITLSLLLDEEDYPFCLKPFYFPFNPYLRIQAVKRSEIENIHLFGLRCHWPMAIIDMDRKTVIYSGNYFRHRNLKKRTQLFKIGQILKESNIPLTKKDENKCIKEIKIEYQTIKPDPTVIEFLKNLFLLPLDRIARSTFINHFKLRLKNKANSLIKYVESISMTSFDKNNVLSPPWNLSNAKRVLNIQKNTTFDMCLAKADKLKPKFAEYIYQTCSKN